MTTIRFFVPERPFAKQRPRFGRGRAWTPAETTAGEDAIRWYAKKAWPPGTPVFTGPVRLTLEFRFVRAARQAKEHRGMTWHTMALDVDNLAKICLDALNPVPIRAVGSKPRGADWPGYWLDDGQVADLRAMKLWADDEHPEGTSVMVEAL